MTEAKRDLVLWFENLRKTDIPIVGGKNASLGEMISAGMPVPPGFAVTAYAYEKFIQETRIAEMIYKIINETVTDKNDPQQYAVASEKIRALIEKTRMPKAIENAVRFALTVPVNVCPLEIAVINQQTPWTKPVIPYKQEHPEK